MLNFLVIVPIILMILFLKFCIVIIKRQWIDKKSTSSGYQSLGQNILMQFQNNDKKTAIEHVIYMEEEKLEEKNNEKLKKDKRGKMITLV